MKEIEILYDLPLIFTKDADFPKRLADQRMNAPLKKGQVIVLPEDVVLVMPPQTMSVELKPVQVNENE